MRRNSLPLPDLTSVFRRFGDLKFQIYAFCTVQQTFRPGSDWRWWFTLIGTGNMICYSVFQVHRIFSVPRVSIENVSLDVVWLMGSCTSATHSLHSLVYGRSTGEFISCFLNFIQQYSGTFSCKIHCYVIPT